MPQFIREIISVCLKMTCWAQTHSMMGEPSFPQRVHDVAGAGESGGGLVLKGEAGLSLLQKLGLMQSYKKGKLIRTIAGAA